MKKWIAKKSVRKGSETWCIEDHVDYLNDKFIIAAGLNEEEAKLMASAPQMQQALLCALGSLRYAANALDVPKDSIFRENIALVEKAIAESKGE